MYKSLSGQSVDTHLLEVFGDSYEKESLKKELTVQNKSIFFRMRDIADTLHTLRMKHQGIIPYELEEKFQALKGEYKKLESEYETEYWSEEDGRLFIPKGFWFKLGNCEDTVGDIAPYYLEGNRHYQNDAIRLALSNKRSSVVLFTGAGKSRVIASICKAALLAGKRTCVVVPTEYLVRQVLRTLKEVCDNVSAVGGDFQYVPGSHMVVTTAQSAMKVVDMFDVVIIDEMHRSTANTWVELLSVSKAEYMYGLTATPFRTDGMDMGLHAFLGPVVIEKNVRWGISEDWLKPVSVYVQFIKSTDGKKQLKFNKKSNKMRTYGKMINSSVIDVVEKHTKAALEKGRKVIVIFKTLAPSRALAARFGVSAADADWKVPLDDFSEGKTQLLVATDRLISEGIDIPDACTLVVCTQHASAITTFQSVGRVLRKAGRDDAIVIDIAVEGYEPFERSVASRMEIYREITDNVRLLK